MEHHRANRGRRTLIQTKKSIESTTSNALSGFSALKYSHPHYSTLIFIIKSIDIQLEKSKRQSRLDLLFWLKISKHLFNTCL